MGKKSGVMSSVIACMIQLFTDMMDPNEGKIPEILWS